jgi:hypothetical protein
MSIVTDKYGNRFWFLNGLLHREDGPAVEWADGTKYWYINGQRHREDGPAIEYTDGWKEWYLNGKKMSEDGPAVEYANGTKEWWLNGEYLTEDEFNRRAGNIIEITRDHAESILEALEWAKSMIKMDGGDSHECLDDDIRKFKEATGL